MEAVVLAAVAGVIGLPVGRFWDTKSESARWRRDQRVVAYEKVIKGYYEAREAIRQVAMAVEPE
jgi:hypothetical protein